MEFLYFVGFLLFFMLALYLLGTSFRNYLEKRHETFIQELQTKIIGEIRKLHDPPEITVVREGFESNTHNSNLVKAPGTPDPEFDKDLNLNDLSIEEYAELVDKQLT